MPELPEVQTIVNQLGEKIVGREIEDVNIACASSVSNPHKFDLRTLREIESIERVGKFIVIHLSSSIKIVVHLRMTGKLVFEERNIFYDKTHLRAEIFFRDGSKLLFISVRGFAKMEIYAEDDVVRGIDNLGIDPFDKSLDKFYMARLMMGKGMSIKAFLMNQKYLAGIGNIYACEILYRVGLHPETKAGCVPIELIDRLLTVMREVLSKAIECCGTTINDYRSVDDKSGRFQAFLQVYQKGHCPCGHTVEKISIGGRGTFFCPVCQKKF